MPQKDVGTVTTDEIHTPSPLIFRFPLKSTSFSTLRGAQKNVQSVHGLHRHGILITTGNSTKRGVRPVLEELDLAVRREDVFSVEELVQL